MVKARVAELAAELDAKGMMLPALRVRGEAPFENTQEELGLLAAFFRRFFFERTKSHENATSPRFLPQAEAQWKENLAGTDSRVVSHILASEMSQQDHLLSLFVVSRQGAHALEEAFRRLPPDPSPGYLKTILVAAFMLVIHGTTSSRIVPCAACPRFFAARTAKALTCSAACRQRFYRATRFDRPRAREKERLRKATARASRNPRRSR
jgi:hypothetical protein